jgi:putative FmdB family regulatory protein
LARFRLGWNEIEMPLYNYQCRRHGEFTEWASLSDFEKPAPCPLCGRPARRSVSAAYLAMDQKLSKAIGASEKSAHEPRVVRRRKGDPIPQHDAHKDLSRVRHEAHQHHHSHASHSHIHEHGKKKTVRSSHPWLVRH